MRSCLVFIKKKTTRDVIVAIPGYFASIYDVTSESVCLTLRLVIANLYIHINE